MAGRFFCGVRKEGWLLAVLVALLLHFHLSQAARVDPNDKLRLEGQVDEGVTESRRDDHEAVVSGSPEPDSEFQPAALAAAVAASAAAAATPWSFIFCRHAESLNNEMKKDVKRGKIWKFLSGGMTFDSQLSEKGTLQASVAHEFMASHFKDLSTLRLMTSTLQRAIMTASIIFEPATTQYWPQRNGGLNEKMFAEYADVISGKDTFEARIKWFVYHILGLPEQDRPEAVVGHSKWYRTLRELGNVSDLTGDLSIIKNTECRRVVLTKTASGSEFAIAESRIYYPQSEEELQEDE